MPPMRAGARDRDPSHTSPNVRKSANTAGESWDYRTTTQRPDSRSSDLVAVRVAFAASPLQAEATYEFPEAVYPHSDQEHNEITLDLRCHSIRDYSRHLYLRLISAGCLYLPRSP